MLRGWIAVIAAGLLGGTPLAASALSFSLNGEAGLNIGQICTAGGAQCSEGGTRVTLDLDPPSSPSAFFPAVGSIDLDLANNLMDITLSVATSVFVGSDNGINKIVFTNTSYVISDLPILVSGTTVTLNTAAPNTARDASVSGTYTQLDGLNAVVVPAQAFNSTARISNQFQCNLTSGNTLLTCGVFFGPGQTSLSVGNAPVNRVFRHGFNFTMVPEPGAAGLLGLGLLGTLGFLRRTRGNRTG